MFTLDNYSLYDYPGGMACVKLLEISMYMFQYITGYGHYN